MLDLAGGSHCLGSCVVVRAFQNQGTPLHPWEGGKAGLAIAGDSGLGAVAAVEVP